MMAGQPAEQAKAPKVNKAAEFLKLSKAEQNSFLGYSEFLHQFLFDSIPDLVVDIAKQRGYTVTINKPSQKIRKQADLNLAIILYANMQGGFPPELAYLICIGIWASSIRVKKDEVKESPQGDNLRDGEGEIQPERSSRDSSDSQAGNGKNAGDDNSVPSNGTGTAVKSKGDKRNRKR